MNRTPKELAKDYLQAVELGDIHFNTNEYLRGYRDCIRFNSTESEYKSFTKWVKSLWPRKEK